MRLGDACAPAGSNIRNRYGSGCCEMEPAQRDRLSAVSIGQKSEVGDTAVLGPGLPNRNRRYRVIAHPSLCENLLTSFCFCLRCGIQRRGIPYSPQLTLS